MEQVCRPGSAWRIASLVIVGLAASACGQGGSGQDAACTGSTCGSASLQSLAVAPAEAFVPVGEQHAFSAQVTYSDGSVRDVSSLAVWSVSGAAASSVGGGVVKGDAAGVSTVHATFQGRSASAQVTVTASGPTSLSVMPSSATMAKGTSAPLVASATYADGSTRDVTGAATWSSSDVAIAGVAGGVVTGVSTGSAVVTASFSGLSSPATVTVSDATLAAIAVAPEQATVPAGARVAFRATGFFSDQSAQDVTALATWSTSDPTVATVAAGGSVHAVHAGATTVRASIGSVTGATALTVTSAALTSLSVNPATVSVPAGLAQPLEVTGVFSDGSTQDVTAAVAWASSDALVASVSSSGLVTGLREGAARVTATLLGLSAGADVTVTAATLQALSLSPGSATLAAGYEVRFQASGLYSDGSTHDVTGQVAWSSSNGAVAALASGPGAQGLVRAVAPGAATIAATLDGKSASAPVAVTGAVLIAIAVDPDSPVLPAGVKASFTATGLFSDQTTEDLTAQVTWTTADPAIATITSAGVAKAVRTGATSVSATLGAVSGSTTLTVVAATLQALEVIPPDATLAKGSSTALQAMGTFSDGSVVDLTAQALWVSDGAAVGVSLVQGVAVAKGESVGTANVTATFSGLSDTAVITVTAATLTALSVDPAAISLPVGLSQQLTVTGTYSDASTQDLTAQVAWSSSNVQVASVSSTGLVSALQAGTARVTASLLGLSAGADTAVTASVLQGITVAPATASVAVGFKVQLTATGTYSDGSTHDVTARVLWSSSNLAAATVSNKQGAQGLVTGVASGTATVTAAAGGVSGTAAVSVTTARLTSIAVTPDSFAIGIRTTQQLRAVGTFDDGSSQDLTRQCAWTSSAKRIARVSQAGVVTGVKRGSATITASKGGRSGTSAGTVN